MKSRLLLALMLGFVFALTACGKKNEAPTPPSQEESPSVQNPPNGQIVPGMSPAERASYCFVYTYPEQDPVLVERVLTQLSANWEFEPARPDDRQSRKVFQFSSKNRHASLVEGSGLFPWTEEITFRKACVSQTLGDDMGIFAGYRIIELMADNNEGAVAFAVKFDTPEAISPEGMMMSERDYERWAAKNKLVTVHSILNNKEIRGFFRR